MVYVDRRNKEQKLNRRSSFKMKRRCIFSITFFFFQGWALSWKLWCFIAAFNKCFLNCENLWSVPCSSNLSVPLCVVLSSFVCGLRPIVLHVSCSIRICLAGTTSIKLTAAFHFMFQSANNSRDSAGRILEQMNENSSICNRFNEEALFELRIFLIQRIDSGDQFNLLFLRCECWGERNHNSVARRVCSCLSECFRRKKQRCQKFLCLSRHGV